MLVARARAGLPHPFPLPLGEGEGEGKPFSILDLRSSILNRESIFLFVLLLTLAQSIISSALDVPPLKGRVNDYAGLMSASRSQTVEQQLERFEKETGHQIAVLTIPSLEGEDLEGFSIKVAETWKIGQKGFDNGAILLIAKNDRKLRIEVGYGLEGVLPDAIASRIIREVIVPRFRANDYPGGIEAGVDAVMKVTRGEPLPELGLTRAQSRKRPLTGSEVSSFAALLFASFLAFMVGTFFGIFFRSKSGSVPQRLFVGGVSGAVTSALVASIFGVLALVGLGIFIIFLGTFLGALGSLREFWDSGEWSGVSRRRHVGWDSDSFSGFGGGGSFGGGGGGFSGGGGGFGGGGASGSW